jgi:hypothetical protein
MQAYIYASNGSAYETAEAVGGRRLKNLRNFTKKVLINFRGMRERPVATQCVGKIQGLR